MFVLILLFTRGEMVAWNPIVSCGVKADLEVSAADEIMLRGVCQQHYLTSLSLISRAQGGAYLFVRHPPPRKCVPIVFLGVCVYVCVSRMLRPTFSSLPLRPSEASKNNAY